MIHIYLDAMGGDNAPQCTVEGAIEALRLNKELKITLAGPVAEIEPLLKECNDIRDRILLDDATEIITNHDAPVMAVRQKKNSAQVKGPVPPGPPWLRACSGWGVLKGWSGLRWRRCCPTARTFSA